MKKNMKNKKTLFLAMATFLMCAAFLPKLGGEIFGAAQEGIAYNEMQTVDTGLVNPATTVLEIKSEADLATSRTVNANIVIVEINGELNALDRDGNVICAVSALKDMLRTSTLIAYKIDDETELDALANYFDANGVTDAYFVAKDPALLYQARKKYAMALGVLDLRGNASLTENDIVKSVNEGYSRIALIDGDGLTVDFVDSLRKRYITVWAQDLAPTRASAVQTVLTGVNGVVSDDLAVYNGTYTEFFNKQTSLVRKTFIIGHRGSTATTGGYSVFGPENTLESAQKAYYDGADYVEIDVHFTLDKEIVVMHDSTLGTMMNATGTVETTSLADLKSYTYKGYEDEDYRIPTLREMIEYFQTTDCMLVIELKDYTANLAKAVTDLVREMQFEDQCVIICFSKQSLEYCYQNAPEISCGGLDSTDHRVYEKIYDEKHDVYKNGDMVLSDTLQSVFTSYNSFNIAFNPAYTGLSEELIRQLWMRGVGTQVWTLYSGAQIDMYTKQGCASLTVDGVATLNEMLRTVSTDKRAYTVNVGDTANVKVQGNYYARSDYDGNAVAPLDLTEDSFAVPMIVEGDAFEVENGKLKAVKAGEATVVYRYKCFSSAGEYYIYSQPISLTATAESEKSGCGASTAFCAPIVISFGVAMCMKKKEKRS